MIIVTIAIFYIGFTLYCLLVLLFTEIDMTKHKSFIKVMKMES